MPLSAVSRRSLAAIAAVAASISVAGCSGGGLSPAQARAATVATVPGGTLKGADLERWLLKLRQPPTGTTANVLISTWINAALAIDAIRRNVPLDDSATTDAVIVPDAERAMSVQYFADRDAKRKPVTDAEADSLADMDRVRVFQQVLVRFPPNADSATQMAALVRVREFERRAHNGADFGALAIEASPDSVVRKTSGYLPPITRDQTSRLPQTMQQIWMLNPGDISVVISSPAGFHLIRRATRAEARPRLKDYLTPILARRADSLFIDSVVTARRVVITPDARARVRALAMEPIVATDSAPLATWRGGSLTPGMVRSATLMLDPAERARLSNASDSIVAAYIKDIARRRIVISVVAPGPNPTPEARKVLGAAYHTALTGFRGVLATVPAALSPADAATRYLDSAIVTQRSVSFPGALVEVLRTRARVRVDSLAVQSVLRAVAPEWSALHANDTTIPARPPAPPGGGRPAAPQPG